MADKKMGFSPEEIGLLTECSWEVCNKIGGIYTVLSTKAAELKKLFGDKLVFIGPDFPAGNSLDRHFTEKKSLLKSFSKKTLPHGLRVRTGRWDIPGSPIVVLVDFAPVFSVLNKIYGEMWEDFHVDSLHGYGDYDESCAFAVAAAIVGIELAAHLKVAPERIVAHYNEWTTGMGLLYTKKHSPASATIFTTHATTIGRSICGNGKPLYQYFANYNGDQMASELNVESKHSVEKAAALNADCFTTVSDVTARECKQLLGRYPDVVTPNGFEPAFVPGHAVREKQRKSGREKILALASLLTGAEFPKDTFIVATSGRNEFRNKGIDLYLDAMSKLADKMLPTDKPVVALILVPAWVSHPSGDLLMDIEFGGWIKPEPDYLTHRLNNEDSDAIACNVRRLQALMVERGVGKNVKFIFIPSYLDGADGILNISYYDFLPSLDLTVFGSYYEPWGYTPLESIAFGVPTLTTDKAGFGEWARSEGCDSLEKNGIDVIPREDTNYHESVEEISNTALDYMRWKRPKVKKAREGAVETSQKAEWQFFIKKYEEAFEMALRHAADRNANKQ